MKKYIKIDGISFEVKNNLNVKNSYELKRLDDCYNNCSSTKNYVYNEWLKFVNNNGGGYHYGVASYNCMMFTFDAMIEFDGKNYYIHITKSNNYIMEVA